MKVHSLQSPRQINSTEYQCNNQKEGRKQEREAEKGRRRKRREGKKERKGEGEKDEKERRREKEKERREREKEKEKRRKRKREKERKREREKGRRRGRKVLHELSVKKTNTKRKPRVRNELRAFVKWRRPTLPRVCSTIGAVGLNFSVRNGKRWNPVAITTGNIV